EEFDQPNGKAAPVGVQTDLFASVVETPTNGTEPVVITVVQPTQNINNTPHEYKLVQGDEAIRELINELNGHTEISFDTETTNFDANDADLVGLSFCVRPHHGWYVPVPCEDRDETKRILSLFNGLFNDESKIWVGHNIKYDLLILKWYGVELKGNVYDTLLAHYLIEPDGKRNMDWLSAKFLNYEPIHLEELIGKRGKYQGCMKDVEPEKLKEYAVEDPDITLQLKEIFVPKLKECEVQQVFNEVENPLVKVLLSMEYEGVRIDTDFLNEYSKVLDAEAKKYEEKVYTAAGVRFNLLSPKQLSEVLFDKLQLPTGKKTKTGQFGTGEDVLQKLCHQYEICDDILAYREYTKLKSTYVDALPLLINKKTGRLHTTYGQAVAVTGRLSSINPNLQNIPIRTDRGREIRKAFLPRDNEHALVSADYSQIELRIVAAISGDKNMSEAFRLNKDVHTATAAKVYNVDESEVTKEMRYKAKSVNFGIIYGQGAFGLSENLKISRNEAREIIENYK
ncbi:MAG: DNA polymerase I, partial [Chitinophagaceae bacterium]|nr:DNA polymerase I [Chitinophagaceae bacterium]